MKTLIIPTTALALFALPVLADGNPGHGGGNREDHAEADHVHGSGQQDEMAIGVPGEEAAVGQTIEIVMLEKDDGSMVFEPSRINVQRGETVRFAFTNKGEVDHEFVMDEHHAILHHKGLMEQFPEMEHADPNAISLEPGQTGEIIWTFSNNGAFEIACLIPGHFESGMRGELIVEDRVTSN